jgi:hypothetical protein
LKWDEILKKIEGIIGLMFVTIFGVGGTKRNTMITI